MMDVAVDDRLRNFVRVRAGGRCEYCHTREQDDSFFRFHVEHIVARQHGGSNAKANLAFACHHCNLHKGPNLSGIDPESGRVVLLFNPRQQNWNDHFEMINGIIHGKTETGRATTRVLAVNSLDRVRLRSG